VLFLGWWDYLAVTGTRPVEAQVFQAWWYAINDRELLDGHRRDIIRDFFPGIMDQDREQRKGGLSGLSRNIARTRVFWQTSGQSQARWCWQPGRKALL